MYVPRTTANPNPKGSFGNCRICEKAFTEDNRQGIIDRRTTDRALQTGRQQTGNYRQEDNRQGIIDRRTTDRELQTGRQQTGNYRQEDNRQGTTNSKTTDREL
ncbi:hypothetical protein BaRGS_00013237 [Batillaria attramentaria]|uniref:Uncharacterized protein n=1 Tax=Batillaria attramentaria TaxID=370345 RepID=A0ABD0L7F3_9CAEN